MLEEEYANPSDEEIERVLMQRKIKNTISDTISNLLYYDRKEDEELPIGKIEECIYEDIISIDCICENIRNQISCSVLKYLGDKNE